MSAYRREYFAAALFATLLVCPLPLGAQGFRQLTPKAAQQVSGALTGTQQSLANKALCAALASQVSNPASASPSLLSSAGVMSVAAASFASSTKLPLPSATGLLKSYVAEHGAEIIASCAVSNATGGLTNKVPGANLPSIPKY